MLVLTWLSRSRAVETKGFRTSDVEGAVSWLAEVANFDPAAVIDAVARAEGVFLAASPSASTHS